MINICEVNKANNTIEHEKLDVRIIILDISLLDCVDSNLDRVNENIYCKITTLTKDLVATDRDIERDFGIPVVGRRISITPISLVGGATCKYPGDFVTTARTLDKTTKEMRINSISGYSIPVSEDMAITGRNLILSIPQAFAETEHVCNSISMGSTKTGLNADAVELMDGIVKETAEITRDNNSLGCVKLVVFCNAPDDNPFMAGALHGVTKTDTIINVGVSGPGVVKVALEKARGRNFEVLCEAIRKTAFKITRVGQLVTQEAFRRIGVSFDTVDLSLVPTPSVDDSVAETLEEIGLECIGAPRATAVLAMLDDQVKKGGAMAFSYVGGSDSAFIPVSEDQGVIDVVDLGVLTLEKLGIITCVCSVGLGMIAIPGDTPSITIAGIIAGEVAIGMTNQKTTAVCLIPVIDKKVGDTAEFGGLLSYTPVIPVNTSSCEKFATREGRIPAPIHGFKNRSGEIHMKLYSIRHRRQCSRLRNVDVDLSEEGHRQASLLGERLSYENIQVVYSSDLLHAIETAQIANPYWNAEHIVHPELREISLGDMESMTDETIAVKYQTSKERQDRMEEDIPYPDGERASDVMRRAGPVFMEMVRSSCERIAVMTHDGVIRFMTAHYLEIPMAKWWPLGSGLENCSITELCWNRETGCFLMERLNNHAHLQMYPELLRNVWVDVEN